MPEDLKVSQIGSSPLPPPFRGLHSPGVRKHCQIIFACYFRKSSINCDSTDSVNIQVFGVAVEVRALTVTPSTALIRIQVFGAAAEGRPSGSSA